MFASQENVPIIALFAVPDFDHLIPATMPVDAMLSGRPQAVKSEFALDANKDVVAHCFYFP